MIEQVTVSGTCGTTPIVIFGAPFMSALDFSLQLAGPVSQDFVSPIPTQRCQLTDEGVSIVVQVLDSNGNPVNLRLTTSMVIILVRPSGVSIETKASYFTNGFDGKMAYNTGLSSPLGTGLDEFGAWAVQGKIVLSGNTQFTAVGSFSVDNNLGA